MLAACGASSNRNDSNRNDVVPEGLKKAPGPPTLKQRGAHVIGKNLPIIATSRTYITVLDPRRVALKIRTRPKSLDGRMLEPGGYVTFEGTRAGSTVYVTKFKLFPLGS